MVSAASILLGASHVDWGSVSGHDHRELEAEINSIKRNRAADSTLLQEIKGDTEYLRSRIDNFIYHKGKE